MKKIGYYIDGKKGFLIYFQPNDKKSQFIHDKNTNFFDHSTHMLPSDVLFQR